MGNLHILDVERPHKFTGLEQHEAPVGGCCELPFIFLPFGVNGERAIRATAPTADAPSQVTLTSGLGHHLQFIGVACDRRHPAGHLILHLPVVDRCSIVNLECALHRIDGGRGALSPELISRSLAIVHFIVHLVHPCIGVYLYLLGSDKAVEVLVVLLRVPGQRVSVDRQPGIGGSLHILRDGGEVHGAVILDTRSHLHGIASHRLVEVGVDEAIDQFLFQIVSHRGANSEFEVGILAAVYVLL